MAFNSYLFWLFFVVVIGIYRILPHRGQNRLLLVASYVFYGAWDARFLLLIALSTVVDFFVAQQLAKAPRKSRLARRWCALSTMRTLWPSGVVHSPAASSRTAAAAPAAAGCWSITCRLATSSS